MTRLQFDLAKITQGLDSVRNMKSLTAINGMPAAEFWEKRDAGQIK